MAKESMQQMTTKDSLTRLLLSSGILSGPFYVLVGFAQMPLRPGFDPTRDDWSLMSNGALGWIQSGNLLISGILMILFALGIRRLLHGNKAGTWGPLLLGLYGLGLIGAGIFVADPMNGFPPGTPPRII